MADDETEAERIVRNHVDQLLEHFDTVRIFVTRPVSGDDGRPAVIAGTNGGGNFYASLGQVREWLVQQDHRACVQAEIADRDAEESE